MKIAVSSKGETLDSFMDPRFGRCDGFIIHDTEDHSTLFLDNISQRKLSQRTGIKAAKMIADAKAEVLLTGQLGPKANIVLSKAGIKIYECTGGTVQNAIDALKLNKLAEFSQDNVKAGPGKMGGRGMGGGRQRRKD
ncbi:MAG: NifB/NifX family molybdenum-iron cluster-binding protein [Desulfobacterales bacterium]|nr:NifB/NifX family molybdenum-iron cluster-binding protein [Desulfobacterales bacterium]